MKKIFNKIILFILFSALLFPLFAYADVTIEPPIKYHSVEEVIGAIVNWVYNIALVIAPLMIMIGGFYLITAAGDPEKVNTGKKIITWTIVGIVVVLLATSAKFVIETILQEGTT
jgi:surface polysaccharide O-acyltransferase-like enzyme